MPKKISDLTTITSIQSGDLVEISRGGTSSLNRDIYDEFSDNLENVKGMIWNIGLGESRASSALTIFFKQKDGSTDLTSGIGRGRIWFRSTTQTSGGGAIIDFVATTSTTINAGNTLGLVASKDEDIHVYAYNDAGTGKIAYSGAWTFDEGILQNITAQGSVATVKTTLFAATAATAVAIKYMGKITFNLGTPGSFVTAPTSIVNAPVHRKQIRSYIIADTPTTHGTTGTKIRRWTNVSSVGSAITYTASAVNGDSFTINEDGLYSMVWYDNYSGGGPIFGFSVNSNQLSTNYASITAAHRTIAARVAFSGSDGAATLPTWKLVVGDVVRCHDDGTFDSTNALHKFIISKIGD